MADSGTVGLLDYLPHTFGKEVPGQLVVIEGPDGSGRSTHLRLLHEWLEWRGFAVKTVGLKKSELLGQDLELMSQRNDLQPQTQLLLYATDLHDQIENRMVPALQAGFVVLADRYILSLLCRAQVRRMSSDYLENLFSYAPAPDLSLRLSIKPEAAFDRLMKKKPLLGHTEFGGDLRLSANLHDSFLSYQRRLHKCYRSQGKRLGYKKIAGKHSVPRVNEKLRKAVAELLGIDDIRYTPSESLRSSWTV